MSTLYLYKWLRVSHTCSSLPQQHWGSCFLRLRPPEAAGGGAVRKASPSHHKQHHQQHRGALETVRQVWKRHTAHDFIFLLPVIMCWHDVCVCVCDACPGPGCIWQTWSQHCTTPCVWSWLLMLSSKERPWILSRVTSLSWQRWREYYIYTCNTHTHTHLVLLWDMFPWIFCFRPFCSSVSVIRNIIWAACLPEDNIRPI